MRNQKNLGFVVFLSQLRVAPEALPPYADGMTCTPKAQQSGTELADVNSAAVRRGPLLNWVFGASLVLLSAILPTTAKASVHHYHHHHDALRHVGHAVRGSHRASVHEAVYHGRRHEGHDVARLVHADYRYDHRSYDHRSYDHHLRYARAESRYEGAHLVRAAYRDEGRYYHRRHISAHYSYSRLQCVPYAREVSHIELSGDAFLWWAEAAGRYQRGSVPVVGAVMNFRPTGRMPLGHVAVVTAVLNSRTVLVTQANWVPGTITNDVTVEDVSADNNWSAVRVELDNTNTMGSVYPVYGFIYKNPPADMSTVIASNNVGGRNEVAEAPIASPIAAEAPDRNLR